MSDRFKYRRQVEAEIARSEPVLGAQLKAASDAGAKKAQQIARREAYLTGDYARSIEGGVVVEDGKLRGRVAAKDFKAGWIEFGTKRLRPRAILTRGVDAAGYKVRRAR